MCVVPYDALQCCMTLVFVGWEGQEVWSSYMGGLRKCNLILHSLLVNTPSPPLPLPPTQKHGLVVLRVVEGVGEGEGGGGGGWGGHVMVTSQYHAVNGRGVWVCTWCLLPLNCSHVMCALTGALVCVLVIHLLGFRVR